MIIGNCNVKCNCVARKHYILSVVAPTMTNLRPQVRVIKYNLHVCQEPSRRGVNSTIVRRTNEHWQV